VSLLERFDPPAFLADFNAIPGQLDAWHRAVFSWFEGSIEMDRPLVPGGEFQFYNPAKFDPGGASVEQAITWNAFPKELLRRYGRERALREADTLWTLDRYYSDLQGVAVDAQKYPLIFETLFRPQNEYCEWHVVRDPDTNQIVRATFTSEPPEFWFALSGGSVPDDDNEFPGDKELLLRQYRTFVSPDVQWDDLLAKEDINGPQGPFALKGQYNPYNKWNTTHGIVHLCAPPNSLTAEIQLGADATVLRRNSQGKLLVEPDALICCAGYGGPDRNSDPTIGASVNALARLGAYVTLKNPVGLYMDHIDLSGWQAPGGKDVSPYVRILRGALGMIERLVVEVPKERGFTVGDLSIGGEAIRYGGQIAECITVKLVGLAHPQAKPIANIPAPCDRRCCMDPFDATALKRAIKLNAELPAGTVAAFVDQGGTEAVSKVSDFVSTEKAKPVARQIPKATHIHRRRAYVD
jgi:hypothetical protein